MTSQILAGVDEVGRGCLAGPVISVAIILKDTIDRSLMIDSKKLTPTKRAYLANYILNNTLSVGIGECSNHEIDRINIHNATLSSMKLAITNLNMMPDLAYIDGLFKPDIAISSECIIQGDNLIPEISAASILAKVYRDKLMIKMSKKFRNYYWNKNFGYGTKQHIMGLKKYGLTTMHRKNFKPIHKMLLK